MLLGKVSGTEYQVTILKHLFKVAKCASDDGGRALFLKKVRSILALMEKEGFQTNSKS